MRLDPRVALAYLAFVLVGISAGINGVALPAQMADYGVDRATVGLTFFTFGAGFFVAGFAAGPLIHHAGLRVALVLACAVFGGSELVVALRPPFWGFVVLCVGAGAGSGMLESALNTYLTDLPRATTLLNRLHAFFGVGALIGPIMAARILLHWPWTAIFVVLAAICVPLLVGFALLHPAHERPDPGSAEDHAHGLLGGTVRQPAVILGSILLTTYVGLEISIGTWAFSYLTTERGQGDLLAGNLVSGYWLGLTLGRFLITPIAARLGWDELRTMVACLAGVAGCALGVWAGPAPVAAASMLLAGFFLGPMCPTVMAAVPRLTEPRRVGTAIGVLNGVSVVGGAALPWLAGWMSQQTALWTLWPYVIVLAVAQVLLWRALARRWAPDAAGACRAAL
jgi:fucose permease